MQVAIDTSRVHQVWEWCCSSYAKVGYILRFPKNTDPQKTYQWRYAARLAKQLDEWDFDDKTCQVFIDHVAAYSKEKRLLRKGLAAFSQTNILQICYDRLEKFHQRSESVITTLARTNHFLSQQSKSCSFEQCLLHRDSPDAFFNVVDWYDIGKLPTVYIALSKSCMSALSKIARIDPDQRKMLPTRSKLFIARQNFVENSMEIGPAKAALGNDWRELCL